MEVPTATSTSSDFRKTFDAQGVGQTQGYIFGVDDVMFRIVAPGDTDGNGEVNSTDLFAILGAGKFNHPELGAASWAEGDFTGDTLVNSSDLFAMLGAAKFNQGPYTSTPPDSGSSLTTTATASTSLLSTIDTSDESGTDGGDQFVLASSGVSNIATYGPFGRGQASHRPNSAAMARSANANTSTVHPSDDARRAMARRRHFRDAESTTWAALGRTEAVDHVMRNFGQFTQARKSNAAWNEAMLDLSAPLLDDLSVRL